MNIVIWADDIIQANGATDDFDIDSGLKKVNIGWTSASITTVRAVHLRYRHRLIRLN